MNRSRSRLDQLHDTAKNIKNAETKSNPLQIVIVGFNWEQNNFNYSKDTAYFTWRRCPRRNPWAFCRQGSRRRCPGHPLSPVSPSGCSPPAQHSHLQYNQSTNQIWHLMNFSKQPNTRATSTSKQWSLQGSGEDPECFDSDPDPTFHIDSDLNPNFILFLWKFGSYKIQIHKSTYFRFSTFKFYFISNQYRYRYGILCLHEGWANFILIVIPPNMIRIRLLTRGEKMESLSGKML